MFGNSCFLYLENIEAIFLYLLTLSNKTTQRIYLGRNKTDALWPVNLFVTAYFFYFAPFSVLWIPLLVFFFFEFRMIQSIKQTQKRGDIFSFFCCCECLVWSKQFLNDIGCISKARSNIPYLMFNPQQIQTF